MKFKEKPKMGKPKSRPPGVLGPKQSARMMKEKYLRELGQRPEGPETETGYATGPALGRGYRHRHRQRPPPQPAAAELYQGEGPPWGAGPTEPERCPRGGGRSGWRVARPAAPGQRAQGAANRGGPGQGGGKGPWQSRQRPKGACRRQRHQTAPGPGESRPAVVPASRPSSRPSSHPQRRGRSTTCPRSLHQGRTPTSSHHLEQQSARRPRRAPQAPGSHRPLVRAERPPPRRQRPPVMGRPPKCRGYPASSPCCL